MVNFPQAGINLSVPSRGPAPRGEARGVPHSPVGLAQPRTATHPPPPAAAVLASPATAGATPSWSASRLVALLLAVLGAPAPQAEPPAQQPPRASAGSEPPRGRAEGHVPAAAAGGGDRAGWHPGRLVSALLRVLAGPSPQADPGPGIGTPQPGADTPTRTGAESGVPVSRLIEALIGVLTGRPTSAAATPSADAPKGPPQEAPQQAAGLPADRGAPRPPEMPPAAAPRPELAAPPVAAGIPSPSPVQAGTAGDPQQPRAELVPPGDGARRAEQDNLPLGPSLLLAVAIPALVAVLASLF